MAAERSADREEEGKGDDCAESKLSILGSESSDVARDWRQVKNKADRSQRLRSRSAWRAMRDATYCGFAYD